MIYAGSYNIVNIQGHRMKVFSFEEINSKKAPEIDNSSRHVAGHEKDKVFPTLKGNQAASMSYINKPPDIPIHGGMAQEKERPQLWSMSYSNTNTGRSLDLVQVFVFLIPPYLTYMESL